MELGNNIDDIIRKKFDSFEPTPPPNVWDAIEKGLDSNKPAIIFNKKWLIGSLLLLLGLSAVIFLDPFNTASEPTENDNQNVISVSVVNSDVEVEDANTPEINVEEVNEVSPIKSYENITNENKNIDKSPVENESKEVDQNIRKYNSDFGSGYIGSMGMKHTDFNIINDDIPLIEEIIEPENLNNPNTIIEFEETETNKKGHWEIGLNIWPELTISNIDSVEILNTYSLNIEPTYYFNDHWFIRSGLGASYVRDRGFAEVKYYTKEFMGTYEDVYNVTFDSIDGVVVPTYHTKTVEVWDSIKHISISNVTNKYLYLNVPLLLGYSFGDKTRKINWHVFAGPVIYFNTGSWIQTPTISDKDAEIIELHNNLPKRNNFYMQLWVGAGLKYKLTEKVGLTVEPSYFYYLTDVYDNKSLSSPTSGFGLRLGLQIKLR